MNDRPDPVVTCQDADVLLASWAIAGVDAGEHRALRRHLAGCAACRAAAAGYRSAADLLALAVDEVEPPPSLRSRLLAAVHAEAIVAPARGPSTAGTPWWTALWRLVPSGRPVTAIGVLATAAAVAVAAVAIAGRPSSSPAPEATVVHACGLTPQPAACGTLRYDPTAQQAVLTVTGLPAVPVLAGRPQAFYEVWLVRGDRSVVPAGFLTETPGSTTYTAAMTGSMSGVVAGATTQEADGGGAVPHGPEVLRIDLPGQG